MSYLVMCARGNCNVLFLSTANNCVNWVPDHLATRMNKQQAVLWESLIHDDTFETWVVEASVLDD